MTSETDSPIDQMTRGAVKGLIDIGKAEITGFITKLKNRELAFVQDVSLINKIRTQKSTPAWDFYSKYVQNHTYRLLVQFGLTLRDLDDEKENRDLFRTRITRGFGTKELHIAEFVASKTLSKYIATLIDTAKSNQDLVKIIENIFNNIDRDYRFIQTKDDVKKEAQEVVSYLKGSLPEIIILVSKGSATKKCKQIVDFIEKQALNYEIETTSIDDAPIPKEKNEYVAFIRRKSV